MRASVAPTAAAKDGSIRPASNSDFQFGQASGDRNDMTKLFVGLSTPRTCGTQPGTIRSASPSQAISAYTRSTGALQSVATFSTGKACLRQYVPDGPSILSIVDDTPPVSSSTLIGSSGWIRPSR